MTVKDFWYVVSESRKLGRGGPLSAQLMGEWLVLFRDGEGRAVALQDRCLHRCAQLSKGRVEAGRLRCAYHGWLYDGTGAVVSVPSEGPGKPKAARKSPPYAVREEDGYVYVRLNAAPAEELPPFRIPFLGARGWKHIRLINRFTNNVTNCAENFVDIPHTVFVHPRIFRTDRRERERFTATVRRARGSVLVEYHHERANFGLFSWFLNPKGREIGHSDHFHMPNTTSVEYRFSEKRRFFITSQSVPVTDEETLVYTDLTYDYGIWNTLSVPIVRRQAQAIIDQDIEILENQMSTIRKYGDKFSNTEADVIHLMVESIRNELAKGDDPRQLPERSHEIEFWV